MKGNERKQHPSGLGMCQRGSFVVETCVGELGIGFTINWRVDPEYSMTDLRIAISRGETIPPCVHIDRMEMH